MTVKKPAVKGVPLVPADTYPTTYRALYELQGTGGSLKIASFLGIGCQHEVWVLNPDEVGRSVNHDFSEPFGYVYAVRPVDGPPDGLRQWGENSIPFAAWLGITYEDQRAVLEWALDAAMNEVEEEFGQ